MPCGVPVWSKYSRGSGVVSKQAAQSLSTAYSSAVAFFFRRGEEEDVSGVDPQAETTREAKIRNSMIIGFGRQGDRFKMQLSAKRRRAMLASNPFKE